LGVRRYVAEFWYVKGVTQDWRAELQNANDFLRKFFEEAVQ